MTSALRARAAVTAEAVNGATRLATLRSDPPVALRFASGAVYMAASAAGPIGGDEVNVEVTVGPGAVLEVRSVAATLALPGPAQSSSRATVAAEVGVGASLRWLPEPVVLAHSCDHRAAACVSLAADATLVWREEMILGRHAEPGGSMTQRLQIDRESQPLLRTEQALGPRWPGSTGPAGTGGHRAVGTLVVVGPGARHAPVASAVGSARVAASAIASDAVVVTAVAPTARSLRLALDQALYDLGGS